MKSLPLKLLLRIAALSVVVFLFYIGLTSALIDRQLRRIHKERGVVALSTVELLLEQVQQPQPRDDLPQIMSNLLTAWNASYVIYPSFSPGRPYVTTHKFGTMIVSQDLIDAVLKQGRRAAWQARSQLVGQEGAVRITIEQLPVVGEFYDFSMPVGDHVLHVGLSRRSVLGHIRGYFVAETVWVGLVLLGGFALLILAIYLLFRPYDRLVDYARSLARRELDVSSPHLGSDEVGKIGARLSEMAGELRQEKGKEAHGESALPLIEELHTHLDKTANGIALATSTGEIALVNEPFCRMRGKEASQLVGRLVEEKGAKIEVVAAHLEPQQEIERIRKEMVEAIGKVTALRAPFDRDRS